MPEDHTIRQGESVISIAEGDGFLWETLWNHPKNAQLKTKRGDPGVLMPGDVLHIPDRGEKKESAGVDQCHNFRRKGTPAVLRVVLKRRKPDPDEKAESAATGPSEYTEPDPKTPQVEAMANVPFALYADGKLVKEGQTGGDGKIEVKVPASSRSARVVLEPGTPKERTLNLNIGRMDPVEEVPGVCKRLNNLGYSCPGDAKEVTAAVAAAIQAFQRENGLEPTGKPDGPTRDRLVKAHGG